MTDVKPGDVAAELEKLADSADYATTSLYDDDLRAAASLIRSLSERNEKLEGALRFYADKDNHKMRRDRSYRDRFSQNMKPGRPRLGLVAEDKGKRARAALERK